MLTDDEQQIHAYTISSPMSLNGSDELKKIEGTLLKFMLHLHTKM